MTGNKIREIAQTLGASARANKYRVSFAFPRGVQGSTDLRSIDTIAKSATAPQKEVGQIELWNQGRKLLIPGDTAFDNAWSLDFYLTENHELRYDLLKWQQACDNFHANIHTGNPEAIFADLRIEQLDSMGEVSAQYTLHNCFPQTVGEVSYGDDSADTPAEFNCTFAYTDFVMGTGEMDDCTINNASKNDTGLTC